MDSGKRLNQFDIEKHIDREILKAKIRKAFNLAGRGVIARIAHPVPDDEDRFAAICDMDIDNYIHFYDKDMTYPVYSVDEDRLYSCKGVLYEAELYPPDTYQGGDLIALPFILYPNFLVGNDDAIDFAVREFVKHKDFEEYFDDKLDMYEAGVVVELKKDLSDSDSEFKKER